MDLLTAAKGIYWIYSTYKSVSGGPDQLVGRIMDGAKAGKDVEQVTKEVKSEYYDEKDHLKNDLGR